MLITYLWMAILVLVIIAGMVYGVCRFRQKIRATVLAEAHKEHGPEVAKALESRMKGEW
jgi:hypothetical protein